MNGMDEYKEQYEWVEQCSTGEDNIWLPSIPNEKIIGVVVSIRSGDYGNQYLLENKSVGLRTWTPSHKVLQYRMEKVQVGDTIKIVYVGQEPPAVRGRNPTRMYQVWLRVGKKVGTEKI